MNQEKGSSSISKAAAVLLLLVAMAFLRVVYVGWGSSDATLRTTATAQTNAVVASSAREGAQPDVEYLFELYPYLTENEGNNKWMDAAIAWRDGYRKFDGLDLETAVIKAAHQAHAFRAAGYGACFPDMTSAAQFRAARVAHCLK